MSALVIGRVAYLTTARQVPTNTSTGITWRAVRTGSRRGRAACSGGCATIVASWVTVGSLSG